MEARRDASGSSAFTSLEVVSRYRRLCVDARLGRGGGGGGGFGGGAGGDHEGRSDSGGSGGGGGSEASDDASGGGGGAGGGAAEPAVPPAGALGRGRLIAPRNALALLGIAATTIEEPPPRVHGHGGAPRRAPRARAPAAVSVSALVPVPYWAPPGVERPRHGARFDVARPPALTPFAAASAPFAPAVSGVGAPHGPGQHGGVFSHEAWWGAAAAPAPAPQQVLGLLPYPLVLTMPMHSALMMGPRGVTPWPGTL